MRRWTLALSTLAAMPQFGNVTIEAFDEDEALLKIARAVGLDVRPCCHTEDPPCERCAEEAERAEQDRIEQAGKAARYAKYGPDGVAQALFGSGQAPRP